MIDRSEMDFPEVYEWWGFALHRFASDRGWFGLKGMCWDFSPGGTIYYSHSRELTPKELIAHARRHWFDALGRVWWWRRDYAKRFFQAFVQCWNIKKAYRWIYWEKLARKAEEEYSLWVK